MLVARHFQFQIAGVILVQVTYYDILGMFVVVYPERLGLVLNVLTMLATVVMVWMAAKRDGKYMY